MLFPPPGVKIRRTIETFAVPDTPILIAEHDPARILLAVVLDAKKGYYVSFAGSMEGLAAGVFLNGAYGNQVTFWGPEEVWAQGDLLGVNPMSTMLVQSVFYD